MNNVRHLVRDNNADVSWIIKAIRGMLRPVVKLCIGRISFTAFMNMSRELYIEEGRLQLEIDPDRRCTKSAMSLLTGLDHRTIEAADKVRGEEVTASQLCPEARILERWVKDPMFCDASGNPRALPLSGSGLTFQRLVQRNAGRGVTAQNVLDRLLDGGNVKLVDSDVHFVSAQFTPVGVSERNILEASAAAWQRLGRTLAYNTNRGPTDDPWLQQDRWTARIRKEDAPRLRKQLRELLQQQISDVEEFVDPFEQPVRTSGHTTIGIGWYYWESESETS